MLLLSRQIGFPSVSTSILEGAFARGGLLIKPVSKVLTV